MKTTRRKTRKKGPKKARTTGIMQQIPAVILLTTLAISHVVVPTAHAGFLDWLRDYGDEMQPVVAGQGINQMFLDPGMQYLELELIPSPITGNAIIAWADTSMDNSPKTVRSRSVFSISAYNSLPEQTDDSPWTGAMGTRMRDGVVASNVLPFGTRLKIPDFSGNKVYVVEDRMNARYNGKLYMDIWMEQYEDAVSFGRRQYVVEVIR